MTQKNRTSFMNDPTSFLLKRKNINIKAPVSYPTKLFSLCKAKYLKLSLISGPNFVVTILWVVLLDVWGVLAWWLWLAHCLQLFHGYFCFSALVSSVLPVDPNTRNGGKLKLVLIKSILFTMVKQIFLTLWVTLIANNGANGSKYLLLIKNMVLNYYF